MNNDMEKYLSSFKLPEAPAGLKERVLNSAQEYRRQQNELSGNFILGVKIFLSAAVIILFLIIGLNSLSSSRLETDTKRYEKAIEEVALLGIPRETAKSMIISIEMAQHREKDQIFPIIRGHIL